MIEHRPVTSDVGDGTPDERRAWLVLAAMSLPLVALSIDVSGIGVALPAIGRTFELGAGGKAWVMNASALSFGAALFAAGALADRWGPRRLLLWGVAAFGLASMLCGVAPNPETLVVARVAQGLASALCFTTSVSVVDSVFPPDGRARAIGIWGAIGGVGAALGPLVAGAFASLFSWRWFFFANVPLCLLALPVLASRVPRPAGPTSPRDGLGSVPWRRIGPLGVLFVAVSIAAGQAQSWISVAIAGAAALGAVAVLLRVRRTTPPVLAPTVVARSSFRSAMVVALGSNWGFGVTLVMMAEYLEVARGQTSIGTGVTMLVFSVSFAGAGFLTARFAALGFRRSLAVAMLIASVGLAMRLTLDPSTPWALVLGSLAIGGLGQGLAFDVSTVASLDGVPVAEAGSVTAAIQTVRLLGLVVGVAVSGAVVQAIAGSGHAVSRADLSTSVRVTMAVALAVAVITLGCCLPRVLATSSRWTRSRASRPA